VRLDRRQDFGITTSLLSVPEPLLGPGLHDTKQVSETKCPLRGCQPAPLRSSLVQSQPDGETRLGERLRALRLDRGLSIAQVAESTGLTKGFLSQLERNLTSVSLSALARICSALGVRFGDVLDEPPMGAVIRRESAIRWTEVGNHEDVVLSPPEEQRLNLIESRIPPGVSAGDDVYTFPADVELIYVLGGSLELQVGDEVLTLTAGETFTYSPRDPHAWRNPSQTEETVVLWFAVPNPYSKPPDAK
jgi:transcriptional regulator with XRE-family HTH domain